MTCGCCFGCIIVLMNTFFGFLALLFIAIGCILHFIADVVKSYFQGMEQTLKDFGSSLRELLEGDETFSVMSLLKQASIPFIIVGVVLFVICILGCCSVYCSSKTLLIVYMSILGIILGAQILAVVIIYVKLSDYRKTAIESLKSSITNDYEGRSSQKRNETTNFFTTIVDLIQIQAACCGVDNYTNFRTAMKWQMKKEPQQQIPISCCVFVKNEVKDAQRCAPANDPEYANIDKPCWSYVDGLLDEQKIILIAVIASILGLQAMILILAICYCQSLGSKIGPV